jgi:hypothetical protein
MPFLEGPFAFTGKLDMLSAYRMRGVDGIVVRRKGGPSGEKVKKAASFENTRRTMSEFGGCSRHGSYVRMALIQIRHLSDYNFGSDINSIMRQVQLRDGTSEWGRRRITLSEHTRLLEGFSTTLKAPSFDSIVRAPIYYTLDRQKRSARIDLPELLRDINYFPQNNHAMFRLTVTLGIVPDIAYDVPSKEYLPPTWYSRTYNSIDISTDWNPSLEGMNNTTLELAMDAPAPPDDAWTLMLSIGIEYGAFRENGKIKEIARFGAAKIMALQGKDRISEKAPEGDGDEEDAAHMIDTPVVAESASPITLEKAPDVAEQPALRYVYTTKEPVTKKQEIKVYSYAVPVAAQNINCTGTSQHAVVQAPPELTPAVRNDLFRATLPNYNFLYQYYNVFVDHQIIQSRWKMFQRHRGGFFRQGDCLRMHDAPLRIDHRHRSLAAQRIVHANLKHTPTGIGINFQCLT